MAKIDALSFLVERRNLIPCEVREWTLDDEALQPGQALLRVDTFALTGNNVANASTGDALNYWSFFPAPDGLGSIPAWGFGEVQASRCEGVKVGERFFGYVPMSTHFVVQPEQVGGYGFSDAAPHRGQLAAVYNTYMRCSRDPLYRPGAEDLQMVLLPLFTASFLLATFLEQKRFFEATCLVLTSASCKTALGVAHQLKHSRARRAQVQEVVGLTSEGNREFVSGLQCYDRVLSYEQITELDASVPTAVLDFAGNAPNLGRLHYHFGPSLRYSGLVGRSRWSQRAALPKDLPGIAPEIFAGPDQVRMRLAEWGGAAFQERLGARWHDFASFASQWLKVKYGRGVSDATRIYYDVLSGASDPRTGHVLSLLPAG